MANTARRQILAAYRACPAGDVFTGMPADVKWHHAALTPAELATVRYIDYPYWTDFSGGTGWRSKPAQAALPRQPVPAGPAPAFRPDSQSGAIGSPLRR